MLQRPEPIRQIELTFQQRYPVTALLGPRQRGKTTLARFFAGQEPSTVFDLENPVDVQRRPLLLFLSKAKSYRQLAFTWTLDPLDPWTPSLRL